MELYSGYEGSALMPVRLPPQPSRQYVPMPTAAKKKRSIKTSSERGRAYRERLKSQLEGLEDSVFDLRQRVAELEVTRSLHYAQSLQRRNHSHGSLARLVHKYYTLFEESMAALPPPSMTSLIQHDAKAAIQLQNQCDLQLRFLQLIMDPDVVAGDLRGPLSILDQWQRYASSHTNFRGRIQEITVAGGEENPVVTLKSHATGKINGATFHILFPNAVKDDQLIRKFLNREVTYEITNRYMFTPDGRICCEIVEIGFLQGLLDIGATLEEASYLMASSAITSHCTLRDRLEVIYD